MATLPRVYDIAKELGIETNVALAKLKELGEYVKGGSSTIAPPVAARLRAAFPKPKTAPKTESKPVAKPAAPTSSTDTRPAPIESVTPEPAAPAAPPAPASPSTSAPTARPTPKTRGVGSASRRTSPSASGSTPPPSSVSRRSCLSLRRSCSPGGVTALACTSRA